MGAPGINRVVLLSLEEIVYGLLSKQGSYSTPNGFQIHVHGVGEDGRELIMPTLLFVSLEVPLFQSLRRVEDWRWIRRAKCCGLHWLTV